jgi:hypothetical protein
LPSSASWRHLSGRQFGDERLDVPQQPRFGLVDRHRCRGVFDEDGTETPFDRLNFGLDAVGHVNDVDAIPGTDT